MKRGAPVRIALQEAQKLGATIKDLPRKPTLVIAFPSGRRERVMKGDRTAPHNLISAINAETRLQQSPASPRKPSRPKRPTPSHSSSLAKQRTFAHGKVPRLSVRGPAQHGPSEIVLARIFKNGKELKRPALIVDVGVTHHLLLGMTRRPHYPDGTPRHKVPAPEECGLNCSTYIWSPQPITCARIDMLGHIGWGSQSLMNVARGMNASIHQHRGSR